MVLFARGGPWIGFLLKRGPSRVLFRAALEFEGLGFGFQGFGLAVRDLRLNPKPETLAGFRCLRSSPESSSDASGQTYLVRRRLRLPLLQRFRHRGAAGGAKPGGLGLSTYGMSRD